VLKINEPTLREGTFRTERVMSSMVDYCNSINFFVRAQVFGLGRDEWALVLYQTGVGRNITMLSKGNHTESRRLQRYKQERNRNGV